MEPYHVPKESSRIEVLCHPSVPYQPGVNRGVYKLVSSSFLSPSCLTGAYIGIKFLYSLLATSKLLVGNGGMESGNGTVKYQKMIYGGDPELPDSNQQVLLHRVEGLGLYSPLSR